MQPRWIPWGLCCNNSAGARQCVAASLSSINMCTPGHDIRYGVKEAINITVNSGPYLWNYCISSFSLCRPCIWIFALLNKEASNFATAKRSLYLLNQRMQSICNIDPAVHTCIRWCLLYRWSICESITNIWLTFKYHSSVLNWMKWRILDSIFEIFKYLHRHTRFNSFTQFRQDLYEWTRVFIGDFTTLAMFFLQSSNTQQQWTFSLCCKLGGQFTCEIRTSYVTRSWNKRSHSLPATCCVWRPSPVYPLLC